MNASFDNAFQNDSAICQDQRLTYNPIHRLHRFLFCVICGLPFRFLPQLFQFINRRLIEGLSTSRERVLDVFESPPETFDSSVSTLLPVRPACAARCLSQQTTDRQSLREHARDSASSLRVVCSLIAVAQLFDLFLQFVEDVVNCFPVESNARGFGRQLMGFHQRRRFGGDAGEQRSVCRPRFFRRRVALRPSSFPS